MNELYKWCGLAFLGISVGILTYFRGYSGKYGVPVTKSASLLIIFLFFLWIPYAYYLHAKFKKKKDQNEVYICNSCNSKYPKKWVQIEMCPKCNGTLKIKLENENESDT